MTLSTHDYIKYFYFHGGDGREQTRWNLADIDDAATLLMELQALEMDYHHLAMSNLRNNRYKEYHSHWGMHWGIKTAIEVIFPWTGTHDRFSSTLAALKRNIELEDSDMLRRFAK